MSTSTRIKEGIDYCRKGYWEQGVAVLLEVSHQKQNDQKYPSPYYSYLGYGIARVHNRVKEGISLCEKAIKEDFCEGDNYRNLALTQLLRGNRRAAEHAVRRGLTIDPQHKGLHKLQNKMGQRRPPVFPFLSRSNPINKYCGMLRHHLLYKKPVSQL